MKTPKIVRSPYTSLLINFLYASGNCILGFSAHSWWFITVGAYYAVLAISRFSVLQMGCISKSDYDTEFFVKRVTGILLVVLALCIMGVTILSAVKDRGKSFHEIIMITIATYTFTKITLAIINMVKARNTASSVIKTLRNISLADACVSIFTMQRSMLVTFPGMEQADIQLFNILTGAAVFLIVLLLGINLIGGRKVGMAKSKIVDVNKKIAETVTDGYKKIEQGVVGGYKKVETGVVNTYSKIEDKFVEAYLTRDGETVEDAKERLKKEK